MSENFGECIGHISTISMRLLIVAQEFPFPPVNGIQHKLYNLLQILTMQHECDLISATPPEDDQAARDWVSSNDRLRLFDFSRNIKSAYKLNQDSFIGMLRGVPPFAARFETDELASHITLSLTQNEYDVVYFDLISMAQFGRLVDQTPIIVSLNDSVSRAQIEASRCATTLLGKISNRIYSSVSSRYEKKILNQFDLVHVVSPVEREWLVDKGVTTEIAVVPISVADEFLKRPVAELPVAIPNTIFWSGNLSFDSITSGLLAFIRKSFPSIIDRIPDVQLNILSRSGGSKLEREIQGKHINRLEYVHDYIGAIDRCHIALFSDAGGTGLQNRLIQAMARGKACVCSRSVTSSFMGVENVHYLACDDDEDYVLHIEDLLSSKTRALKLGNSARNLVEFYYSHAAVSGQWNDLFKSMLRGHDVR
ncbi:MAG: glycosyltransferase family 4 protein [Halioglobus sp.]